MVNTQPLVSSYSAGVFGRLNEFEISREQVEKELAGLSEPAKVIMKHDLHKKVAISLLHKHFDLEEDEYLLKAYEAIDQAFIRPTRNKGNSVVPYLWKVEPDTMGNGYSFYPLEFVRVGDYSLRALDLAEEVEQSVSFLQEMASCLIERGLHDIFGIATMHSAGIPKEGESWQETTDHENRILTLRLAHYVPSEDSIQTLWRALDVLDPARPQGAAKQVCNGHPKTCLGHCNGHHCVKHQQVCNAHPRPAPPPPPPPSGPSPT